MARAAESMKFRLPLRGEDGSVSVFFIVITAAIFTFMAVFIDYARIAVFNRQAETAARSGVRSVLSAYDSPLYEKYGLFGRGGTDSNGMFNHVAGSYLEADDEQNVFRLTDGHVESAHVDDGYSLGLHSVFLGQVLEEMKYKAPVDFALEMADKFRPIAGVMKEAGGTVRLLEKLQKHYESRQAHLSQTLSSQREAAQAVAASGLAGLIPAAGTSPGSVSGGTTVFAIAQGYVQYAGWVAEDADLEAFAAKASAVTTEVDASTPQPRHGSEIAAFRQAASAVASRIQAEVAGAEALHQRLQASALQELSAAEADNTAMADLVREADASDATAAADAVPQAGTQPSAETSGASGDLRNIRKTANELLLPDSWFTEYRGELGQQTADYAALNGAAGSFQAAVLAALGSGSANQAAALAGEASSLKAAYEHYAESFLAPESILAGREAKISEGAPGEQERKEQEAAAASKWREAKSRLSRFTKIPRTQQNREEFNKLSSLYKESMTINSAAAEQADPQMNNDPSGDGGEAAADALAGTDRIFGGMAGMLTGVRNTLYVNEYAVHRFQSFTPMKLKGILDGGENEELSQSLHVKNQEVEYILYGLNDPAGNLAAAYGEIFAFRLAARMMEGLIECKSMGNPLVILAAALVYGLEKSMEDMASLLNKGSTPLSKYIKAEVSYLDYLRMFLLLHGSEEGKLSRIIAIIEYETGYDLAGIPAGAAGEITASVNLWFLPGVMKLLGRSGIFRGKVVGSRYETTKTAAWSY